MMDDCPAAVNYISRKLETLPLTDYLFTNKKTTSDQDINKDIFYVKSNNGFNLPHSNAWNFNFSNMKNNDILNDVKKSIFQVSSEIVQGSSELKNPALCDDGEDSVERKNDIGSKIEEEKLCKDESSSEESDTTTPTRGVKVGILSPVFSDSLPTSHVKRSPNKRKRSSDDISFTQSCDFEGPQLEFRDIQRTLSLDEELLRCDEEIAAFTSRNFSLNRRSRLRPSIRLTCKSQPSCFDDFDAIQPKARKVKIVQVKTNSDNLKKSAPLFLNTDNRPIGDIGNSFQPINFSPEINI